MNVVERDSPEATLKTGMQQSGIKGDPRKALRVCMLLEPGQYSTPRPVLTQRLQQDSLSGIR